MKNKNILSLLISSVSAAVLLNSCGQQRIITNHTERTEISFSWWGNDSRHDYTLAAIKDFEELYPDIRVKCNYAEWAGYQTRYNAQMVSKTEADVMQINYAWLNEYSIDGSGYYDLDLLGEHIEFSNYSSEDLLYGYQNGVLNAIPIALNTETIYINKTIYDEYNLDIPKTWDDFYKAANKMNGKCYPLSMSKKPAFFLIVSYIGELTGKEFMDKNGKIFYTRTEIKQMIEFYKELIDKNVIPKVEHYDKLNISNGNYAGTVAWISDAKSYCSGAQKNGYEMIVADYITINGKLSNWYSKPATMYAVSKHTEHPKEAALLLNYLVNSEQMAEHQKIEKGIPLNKAARTYLENTNQLEGIQFEAFNKLEENKNRLEIISPYFENENIIDTFFSACNEVIFEKSDIDEQTEILYKYFNDYDSII